MFKMIAKELEVHKSEESNKEEDEYLMSLISE